ncbi:hypothetical protein ScPMuIL_013282 [Solemya velum]
MVGHGWVISHCLLVLGLTTTSSSRSLPGNITVAGVFQIHKSTSERCSSDVIKTSVQHLEAVKWVFKRLNENNYIPGRTIGFSIYETCERKDEASSATFRMLNEMETSSDNSLTSAPNILAVIGPESNEETGVVSGILSYLPPEDRIAQIGFSITASRLANASVYPNLFRVVPNDSIEAKVMVSLLKKIGWNYIAILFVDSVHEREAALHLKTLAEEDNICVRLFQELSVSESGGIHVIKLTDFIKKSITIHKIGGLVFYGNADKVESLIFIMNQILEEIAEIPAMIFSGDLRTQVFKDGDSVIEAGKGSFVVSVNKRETTDFAAHWKLLFQNQSYLHEEALTNPWLLDVFENTKQCRPSKDIVCDDLSAEELMSLTDVSLYTSYAIEAAYAIAKSLSLTLEDCGENCQPNPGKVMETLKNVYVDHTQDFVTGDIQDRMTKFDVNHDVVTQNNLPLYDIYNFRDSEGGFDLIKVGEWIDSSLALDLTSVRDYRNGEEILWPHIKKAQCPVGEQCDYCISAAPEIPYAMYYEPGDVLVVALMPIFNRGTGPLMCDGIRLEFGLQVAQGLVFITEKANRKTGVFKDIFPGMHVGLVVLDSCNSALVAEEALITLFKKGVRLLNGTYIQIEDKIIGFIGEQGSTVSLAGYNIIGKKNYVQVSYASTNPVLSDRNLYPLFMRVTTPDDKQGAVMIDIAKQLNYTYIQIVYSVGKYGEGGRDSVREAAGKNKVCIAQEIAVEEFKDYDKILNELRKEWHAKFVIIFLRSHVIGDVMEKLNNQMENGNEFTFLGSEAWGSNKNNLRKNTKLVGSLTVALEMGQQADFNSHLVTLRAGSYPNNPWLKTYLQGKLECHFDSSFDKREARECDDTDTLANYPEFEQDIWTPFAMNTLVAYLLGANQTFFSLCGNEAKVMCPNFHTKPQELIKNMKKVEIDTQQNGQPTRVFDDNGDGMAAYTIYNIQFDLQDSTKLVYKHVGDAPHGQPTHLHHSKLVFPEVVSECPNPQKCLECFPVDVISDPSVIEETDNTVLILGCVLGVALAILSLFLIVTLVKLRTVRNDLQATRDYIHPKRFFDMDTEPRAHDSGEPRYYRDPMNNFQLEAQTTPNPQDE